mmetsp:Transcript_54771/g.114513  ORF Transcript_54771/g.114513 Transcript_54771/m.114513 type:complete len:210 (+) Transcript_54771:8173-8802(+)
MMQEAMGIDYHNPICGTTACQDLAFSSNDVRFVLSTWNSAEYQMAGPYFPQSNCVAHRGTAKAGSSCIFPFEYKGQVFGQCTTQDYTVPWCSTTPVFQGLWGECVCDRLRRGLRLRSKVRIIEEGPLFQERGSALIRLLKPLSSIGITDVNGTLEVFFPWFDSKRSISASNNIEMKVMFLPKAAMKCEENLSTSGANASGPRGQCERLG